MASARVTVGFDSESRCDTSDSDINDDFLGSDDNNEPGGNNIETIDENTESVEADETETTQENANSGSGITDVMAKILGNTVPQNKGLILARGQTDQEINRKRKLKEKESEAEGKPEKKKKKKSKDGGGSSSDWTTDESDGETGSKHRLKIQKVREWHNLGRVKPTILNKEKERMLQKIATSGVVRIFNAVRQQQNTVKEKLSEAGSSVRRRDKVMGSISKKHFLDLLDSSQTKSAIDTKDKTRKTQDDSTLEPSGGKWSILRDDYMTQAKMKDWDKDSDQDQ